MLSDVYAILVDRGIPLQGHDGNDNFTQLLPLLGSKDSNITHHISGKVGNKYSHHDAQNELLNLMGTEVLRIELEVIRDHRFLLHYSRRRN